ncbi:TQXA domain-containing protein [Streptomyces sp. GXMU-J5]|uniref:TQXA domain-containing protein n=2 Tax=Streptomyces beihaiensis TaxID=2984495 RepID=A0ABT3TWR2_9ACTN|nr:LAETG motif-containing sortase-dependent surface protein [Streptomyces beihaiensis]MCX3061491.1 TQXA domain-containing protein [Streptomyces beihaiensis]
MAGAGAAFADDDDTDQSGASATIGGLETYGAAVIHEGGRSERVFAGLFRMTVDGGGTLRTYGVDIHNPTQTDAKYQETSWSGTSLNGNPDAGKIRWILEHSYPQVNDLAALARKAGADTLTEQDAATGTQVGIWRYSDHADVDAVSPAAEKLADYLDKHARSVAEPRASLTLTPRAVSGRPGKRLGPVTVHTGADTVGVTPPAEAAADGVKVVDKAGRPVTSVVDGGQIYFDVPKDAAAGSAALTVQGSTTVPVGRAFVSGTRSQTQILAGSSESTVSATATATWAKKGAVPALSAAADCKSGGVDIAVANPGDEPFTFTLMSVVHTIPAKTSRTVTIPLQEDQAYDFTIKGPHGLVKRIRGVLDCRTSPAASPAGNGLTVQAAPQPSPASVGGTGTGSGDRNLAETGSSNATPVIAGAAIALVLAGGAALVLSRGKKAPQAPAASTPQAPSSQAPSPQTPSPEDGDRRDGSQGDR